MIDTPKYCNECEHYEAAEGHNPGEFAKCNVSQTSESKKKCLVHPDIVPMTFFCWIVRDGKIDCPNFKEK